MKFTKIVYTNGSECVLGENGMVEGSVITWFGDSTRPKPTKADGARDGHRLYESDTQEIFVFNENTESWDEM